MKRIFLFVMAGILTLTLVSQSVSAQEESPVMTDAHIERIRANCRYALGSIQQLHTSDAPLRVNRGQLYEAISSKLMTRLNSRLAQGKYDASSLVKITSEYSKTLAAFRPDYIAYDDQMSDVLEIDCTKQPVKFYDAVAKARTLREKVHQDVVALRRLIMEYQDAYSVFYDQYKTNASKKNS